MATIINNPAPATDSNSGMGVIVGLVLLVILAVLFFNYALPAMRSVTTGPQVNVPGKIDVNVQTPQK